jgi:hypothetical protein
VHERSGVIAHRIERYGCAEQRYGTTGVEIAFSQKRIEHLALPPQGLLSDPLAHAATRLSLKIGNVMLMWILYLQLGGFYF